MRSKAFLNLAPRHLRTPPVDVAGSVAYEGIRARFAEPEVSYVRGWEFCHAAGAYPA
jgi:hypothetical protein